MPSAPSIRTHQHRRRSAVAENLKNFILK